MSYLLYVLLTLCVYSLYRLCWRVWWFVRACLSWWTVFKRHQWLIMYGKEFSSILTLGLRIFFFFFLFWRFLVVFEPVNMAIISRKWKNPPKLLYYFTAIIVIEVEEVTSMLKDVLIFYLLLRRLGGESHIGWMLSSLAIQSTLSMLSQFGNLNRKRRFSFFEIMWETPPQKRLFLVTTINAT